MEKQPLISNIQRYSVNDGPGIRTCVFIKGCPLHCAWCHNPECISTKVQIYWRRLKCQQCGLCLSVCPNDAIYPPIPVDEAMDEDSTYYKINLEKCDTCLKCVEICPYEALARVGDPYTIDQILNEVERDFPFYINSGGGMTLSGGEPTTHPEFTTELLKQAKQRGLHVCFDTSGYCQWEILQGLKDYVDIFLFDLKHIDSKEHQRMTSVPNEIILSNLKKLSENKCTIRIRIPVIPDFNDSEEYHEEVAKFLNELSNPVQYVDLLPFHNWCQDKYRWLGKEWPLDEYEALDPSEVEPLQDIYEAYNIQSTIGG